MEPTPRCLWGLFVAKRLSNTAGIRLRSRCFPHALFHPIIWNLDRIRCCRVECYEFPIRYTVHEIGVPTPFVLVLEDFVSRQEFVLFLVSAIKIRDITALSKRSDTQVLRSRHKPSLFPRLFDRERFGLGPKFALLIRELEGSQTLGKFSALLWLEWRDYLWIRHSAHLVVGVA